MTRFVGPALLSVCLLQGCSVEDGVTGLRGRVREAVSRAPLPGVVVSVGDDAIGWVTTTTDADGRFEVLDYDLTATRMRLDGRPASTVDARYPDVTTQLHPAWLRPGLIYTIPEDKYLPRIDDSTAVDLTLRLTESTDPEHPAEEGWQQVDPAGPPVTVISEETEVPGAEDPAGEPIYTTVYAVIAPGAFIKFPEGADPVITVTQVPLGELPHRLPDYVSPLLMVTFQPGGTLIDPPAELHFGDLRGIGARAPDMGFTVWSLSHSLALFLELGGAHLASGPFGAEIATDEGVGLGELGWHGPVCTSVNFVADVRVADDGIYYPPADSMLGMQVVGGGGGGSFSSSTRNRGGRIETGTVSSCGGYFDFEFTLAGSGETLRHTVGGWRCALNPGDNLIGTITIDLTGAAPTMNADFRLPSC